MRKKKNPTKKSEGSALVKVAGLFDHVKHIQRTQNPNYFNTLSELDQKTFNHFMILKALSMNPEFLDCASTLFKYFDIIPSAQLYTLLIGVYSVDPPKVYYPWIKSKKKSRYPERVYKYVAQKFEVSPEEAEGYAEILSKDEKGTKELRTIIQGFGIAEKEIDKLMAGKDEDE